MLLRGIHTSWSEGNHQFVTGILRSLLDASAAGQNDQIGERYFLASILLFVERTLNPLHVLSTFANWVGWFTSQSFCGARRMRAPFAPPRLSDPRNVDADAHAVETNSDTERPETRILRLREAMSFASISL